MNEDLTQATSQLAYQTRQLRRNGLIDETWTNDGRVFIKKNGRSRGVLVRSLEDLVKTLHDGDDSDEEGRKIAPPAEDTKVRLCQTRQTKYETCWCHGYNPVKFEQVI